MSWMWKGKGRVFVFLNEDHWADASDINAYIKVKILPGAEKKSQNCHTESLDSLFCAKCVWFSAKIFVITVNFGSTGGAHSFSANTSKMSNVLVFALACPQFC